MCDPVSGAMAFLSVMQVQQQQEAAVKEANAVNDAFRENNEMQNEAYNKDMEAFWDEEVNIQEEMYDNAEEAAEASLAMKIQQKSDVSSMLVANAETTAGGGGTPQALLGNLRRSQLNTAMDLDDNFQRGVVALGGELSALQRDKVARRNQAIGAINSAPRASYQSQESKFIALGMAGASAYVQGQAIQGKNLFGGTSPTTTGRLTPGQKNPSAMRQRRIGTRKGYKSNILASSSRNSPTVNIGPYGRTGGGSGFWNSYYSNPANSSTGAWNKYRGK
jgi:hypothetical protein